MSSTAADTPAQAGSFAYDPGLVRRLRIIVTASRPGCAEPDEGYLLDLQPGAVGAEAGGERWDERPWADALLPVAQEVAGAPAVRHTWRVVRRQGGDPGALPDAEVALHLVVPPGPHGRSELPTDTTLGALRPLVPVTSAAPLEPPDHLTHDAAVTAARRYAAAVSPVAAAGELHVTDEEHRHDPDHDVGVWAVGLVAADGTRLEVEVGRVGGHPHSAHVVRHAPEEVVDSVGVE